MLGLVGHGKKSEFYFERDRRGGLEDSEHQTDIILIYAFKGSICCGENGLQGAMGGVGKPPGNMLCYFSTLGFHTLLVSSVRILLFLSFYPILLLILTKSYSPFNHSGHNLYLVDRHYSRFLYLQHYTIQHLACYILVAYITYHCQPCRP